MEKVNLKAEITCESCGYFENVEYHLEEGLNTLEWKCPKCQTKRVMSRIIKKEEERENRTIPRIGKPEHNAEVDRVIL